MNESLSSTHRNGVPWHQAPIPRRLHRCTPWTVGIVNGNVIERCACGGLRFVHGPTDRPWLERNTRHIGEG